MDLIDLSEQIKMMNLLTILQIRFFLLLLLCLCPWFTSLCSLKPNEAVLKVQEACSSNQETPEGEHPGVNQGYMEDHNNPGSI